MADREDPARVLRPAERRLRARRHRLGRADRRQQRVERERMQQVGDDQFLVLHLVMAAENHAVEHLRRRPARDQPLHRRIDMAAVGHHLVDARAGDQAAPRAGVPRPGLHVIGVEEEGEPVIRRTVAGRMLAQDELLEEPGRVREMPLGRAGVLHRLHDHVLGPESGNEVARAGPRFDEKIQRRVSFRELHARFRHAVPHFGSRPTQRRAIGFAVGDRSPGRRAREGHACRGHAVLTPRSLRSRRPREGARSSPFPPIPG